MSDRADRRGSFKVEPDGTVPVGPGPATSFDPSIVDFGHYAGRTIAELADSDPDYVHWLERHPSGARYRGEIRRVLDGVRAAIDRAT